MNEFRRYSKTAQVLGIIAVVNFLSFLVATVVLGGDAISGHIEAGRYFLSSHGKLTETTHNLFRYSQIHGASLFLTHPLALLAGWLGRPT